MNRFLSERMKVFKHKNFSYLSLLLITASIFIVFSTINCTCSNSNTTSSSFTAEITATPGPVTSNSETLNPKNNYLPGEKVELLLSGKTFVEINSKIIWYPPDGATNISFPDDFPPERGGPPFIFSNLTPQQLENGLSVSYNAPLTQQDYKSFYDGIKIENNVGRTDSILIHYQDSSNSSNNMPHVITKMPINTKEKSFDPVPLWQVVRFTDIDGEISKTVCETIVSQGKSANNFMVWRVPISDNLLLNQQYLLPFVQDPDSYPKTIIQSGPINVEMPMEINIPATKWANNNLPEADGELWIALNIQPNAEIECPDITRQGYSIISVLTIDLSNQPDMCKNCVIPAYTCYREVTENGVERNKQSISTDEFNCLGPAETQLVTNGNWFFEPYTSNLTLKPSDEINIHYWIDNDSGSTQIFGISGISSLPEASWTIRPGLDSNPWEPNPDETVGPTISIEDGQTFHLYIQGTVPVDTQEGIYYYRMTVNNNNVTPVTWIGSTSIIITEDGSLPKIKDSVSDVNLRGFTNVDQVEAGDELIYTMVVENIGATALTNLILSSSIPTGTIYLSCSDGDQCAINNGTVTWSLANLGSGVSRSFTLKVKANPSLVAGTLIQLNNYNIQTHESVSAIGNIITVSVSSNNKLFLPLLLR